jgi:hypothetical protein
MAGLGGGGLSHPFIEMDLQRKSHEQALPIRLMMAQQRAHERASGGARPANDIQNGHLRGEPRHMVGGSDSLDSLRSKLERLKNDRDAMRNELGIEEATLANAMNEGERADANEIIDGLKAEIARLNKQIADVEEKLRLMGMKGGGFGDDDTDRRLKEFMADKSRHDQIEDEDPDIQYLIANICNKATRSDKPTSYWMNEWLALGGKERNKMKRYISNYFR